MASLFGKFGYGGKERKGWRVKDDSPFSFPSLISSFLCFLEEEGICAWIQAEEKTTSGMRVAVARPEREGAWWSEVLRGWGPEHRWKASPERRECCLHLPERGKRRKGCR